MDSTTPLNDTLAGATNQPALSPTFSNVNATAARIRLPMGPAAAITAARLGYRAAQ